MEKLTAFKLTATRKYWDGLEISDETLWNSQDRALQSMASVATAHRESGLMAGVVELIISVKSVEARVPLEDKSVKPFIPSPSNVITLRPKGT